MKRIFLDIDGVVNHNGTYRRWKKLGSPRTFAGMVGCVERDLIAEVDALAAEVGGGIVVSSNWRYPHTCPYPVDDVLRAAGLTAPILGHTPMLLSPPGPYEKGCEPSYPRYLRGHEISAYVVEQGLALDDDTGALYPPEGASRHGGRVVITSSSRGLLPKHIRQARALLIGKDLIG